MIQNKHIISTQKRVFQNLGIKRKGYKFENEYEHKVIDFRKEGRFGLLDE